MAEQDKPFVVNDRRKFRMDGELREPAAAQPAGTEPAEQTGSGDAGAKVINFGERAAAVREQDAPTHAEEHRGSGPIPINSAQTNSAQGGPVQTNSAHLVTPVPEPGENASLGTNEMYDETADDTLPAPPTAEETRQVAAAYTATAERLDTVMRATNPGGEHLPPMDFTRLVQSVYMTAMMQLGAGTPQGEQARVDLLGAKQSIDMLSVIAQKSDKSLDLQERKLIESALFELRMGFLEMTQLLARQASAKQGTAAGATAFGAGGPSGGPRIVS